MRPIRGGVLIKTDLADGLEIDARRRMARIPAGTQWGTVVQAAAARQFAVPHGSSPSVGAVRFMLRGGLSMYGRKVGLGVNTIRASELVTADGQLRRVDAWEDPELFWALRGGGGGLGVVTAVEIEMFALDRVFTGAAYWPAAYAGQLLDLWRRWSRDAPWEATTSVRVMNMPVHPAVPPVPSAGPVFCVDGAIAMGDGGEGVLRKQVSDLFGPMRAVAEPILDSWHLTTPVSVLEARMDPTEPISIIGDHMLLDEIGDDGAEAFLRVTSEGSPLIVAGLRQLGDAFAVEPPGAGAFGHTSARYSYAASAVPMPGLTEQDIRGYLNQVSQTLQPWDTGRTILSFVEDFDQPQGHLGAEQAAAVDQVRDRVDPDGVFRGDIAPGSSVRY